MPFNTTLHMTGPAIATAPDGGVWCSLLGGDGALLRICPKTGKKSRRLTIVEVDGAFGFIDFRQVKDVSSRCTPAATGSSCVDMLRAARARAAGGAREVRHPRGDHRAAAAGQQEHQRVSSSQGLEPAAFSCVRSTDCRALRRRTGVCARPWRQELAGQPVTVARGCLELRGSILVAAAPYTHDREARCARLSLYMPPPAPSRTRSANFHF